MDPSSLTLTLASPDQTADAARLLARNLDAGDVILLEGPIGAGKSHFCRHLIKSILSTPEDVPSPTFTLVQSYETERGPLWHSDLYRIQSTYEIEELGLLEAFEDAICLVEWPDRLGDLSPPSALTIRLSYGEGEEVRLLHAHWSDRKWIGKTQDWIGL